MTKGARKRKIGRPLKYSAFLAILENRVIYSPRLIVAIGEALGFFGYTSKQEREVLKKEAMYSLATLAYRELPRNGSGVVSVLGSHKRRREKGWLGQLWKGLMIELSWDYARSQLKSFRFRLGDSLPELRHPRCIPVSKPKPKLVLPTAEQIREIRARNAEHARVRMTLTARRCAVVHTFFR